MNKKFAFATIIVLIISVLFILGCTKDDAIKVNKCNISDRKYITSNSTQCSTLSFMCEKPYKTFRDECGCGCEPVSNSTAN